MNIERKNPGDSPRGDAVALGQSPRAGLSVEALAVVLVPLVVGLVLADGHLGDRIWYDESYTLVKFVEPGFGAVFTDYHLPNNHILFSASLRLWQMAVPYAAPNLRLLPLAFFFGGAALTALAFRRLAGWPAGLLAAMVFVTSHVTLNFSAQLRGYGMSWVFTAGAALLLAGGFHRFGRGRSDRLRAVLYVALAAAAVGTVPTNLLVFGVLAAWVLAAEWVEGKPTGGRPVDRRRRRGIVLTALAPFVGIAFYLPTVASLTSHGMHRWTELNRFRVLGQWFGYTLVDYWWLAPFALLGAVGLFKRRESTSERDVLLGPRGLLCLCAAVVAVPVIALLALPRPPFPRVLVPLLPLWYGVLGLLSVEGLRLVYGRFRQRTARIAVAVPIAALCVLAAGAAWLRESDNAGYARRFSPGDRPQTIYDQYYRAEWFRPDLAIDRLEKPVLPQRLLVLTDDGDPYALLWYVMLRPSEQAPTLRMIDEPTAVGAPPGVRIALVSRSREGAQELLRLIGRSDTTDLSDNPMIDTGFYKAWLLP